MIILANVERCHSVADCQMGFNIMLKETPTSQPLNYLVL